MDDIRESRAVGWDSIFGRGKIRCSGVESRKLRFRIRDSRIEGQMLQVDDWGSGQEASCKRREAQTEEFSAKGGRLNSKGLCRSVKGAGRMAKDFGAERAECAMLFRRL